MVSQWKRIYPKLSKEESDKQWVELQEKYKKESGVNFGDISHPRKLTIIDIAYRCVKKNDICFW
jgi:hypothetical protein